MINHAILFLLQWSLSCCTQWRLKKHGKSTNNFSSSTVLTFLMVFSGVNTNCSHFSLFGRGALRQRGGGHGCKSTQLQARILLKYSFPKDNTWRKKMCGSSPVEMCFFPGVFSPLSPHIPVQLQKSKGWNSHFVVLGIIISAFRQILNWLYSYYCCLHVFTWLYHSNRSNRFSTVIRLCCNIDVYGDVTVRWGDDGSLRVCISGFPAMLGMSSWPAKKFSCTKVWPGHMGLG